MHQVSNLVYRLFTVPDLNLGSDRLKTKVYVVVKQHDGDIIS